MEAELKRLSIAVQVLSDGQLTLTRSVAELAERVESGFAGVDARFEAVDARFGTLYADLKQVIDARHAELVSALMTLGKR